MDEKIKVVKEYCDGERPLTPISNLFDRGPLKRCTFIKYLDKMCDITGWCHTHGINVNSSLYYRWECLSKLIGRKQDYTTVISWGYRSAFWVEELGGHYFIIVYNKRGIHIECDPKMASNIAYKVMDYLEETLL